MRKLPVLGTLRHAFKSTTDNIGFAFHISWPWMLLLLTIGIVGNIYLFLNPVGDPEYFNSLISFMALLMIFASVIAYSSIAVNWHRYILLDEVTEGWKRLRIDGLMWRYIGNAIGILLLVFCIMLISMIPVGLLIFLGASMGNGALVIIVPAYLALTAFAFVSSYRYSVKLPSVAIGRTDFKLRDAWKATSGNFWQILGLLLLFFLCMLLVGLLMLGISYVLVINGGHVEASILLAMQMAVNWVATILGVTLLTSLYGFFVEGREF